MRVLAAFGLLAVGLAVAFIFIDPFSVRRASIAILPPPGPGDDQASKPRNDDAVLPTRRDGARHNTIEDCMAVWDPGTHLTEQEWRHTCERTLQAPHL